MSELSNIINVGKVLESELKDIGIDSYKKLASLGSKKVWLKIKEKDNSACLSKLCGIEGAIRGVRWHKLPDNVKQELKEFYNNNK